MSNACLFKLGGGKPSSHFCACRAFITNCGCSVDSSFSSLKAAHSPCRVSLRHCPGWDCRFQRCGTGSRQCCHSQGLMSVLHLMCSRPAARQVACIIILVFFSTHLHRHTHSAAYAEQPASRQQVCWYRGIPAPTYHTHSARAAPTSCASSCVAACSVALVHTLSSAGATRLAPFVAVYAAWAHFTGVIIYSVCTLELHKAQRNAENGGTGQGVGSLQGQY